MISYNINSITQVCQHLLDKRNYPYKLSDLKSYIENRYYANLHERKKHHKNTDSISLDIVKDWVESFKRDCKSKLYQLDQIKKKDILEDVSSGSTN